MAIKCYDTKCKYHGCHIDPNDGPFCYEKECGFSDLHCGACMQKFESVQQLSDHLLTCPESKILEFVHSVWNGNDQIGHPVSHFIACFKKAAEQNLIRKYAYAVADETDTLKRASLHLTLCNCMDIPYNKFRPFESEKITTLPSRDEALSILCEALFKVARSYLKGENT